MLRIAGCNLYFPQTIFHPVFIIIHIIETRWELEIIVPINIDVSIVVYRGLQTHQHPNK